MFPEHDATGMPAGAAMEGCRSESECADMTFPSSCRIHPTAVISPETELGENVEIGAFAFIEGKVRIGDDSIIRPGAYLYGPLTMGRGNTVYTGAVLGEKPQHLRYNNEPTCVEIGDHNLFREHVTVHRGTTQAMKTVIGSHNFFMVGSHVAHDCVVGDRCLLANGAMMGGHCVLHDNVIISGNSAIHQFARIGRLAMISGISASTKDVPPFIVQQGIDSISGINVIGMKRAGHTQDQINAVREAFRILFRSRMVLPAAIDRMDREMGNIDVVQEMLTFLRDCKKGINMMRGRLHEEAA
jgi:UDP-N-acetylglucosamine acyltransferase